MSHPPRGSATPGPLLLLLLCAPYSGQSSTRDSGLALHPALHIQVFTVFLCVLLVNNNFSKTTIEFVVT